VQFPAGAHTPHEPVSNLCSTFLLNKRQKTNNTFHTMISLIHHPEGQKRLGELLVENLSSSQWTTFRAAVAIVKIS